MAEGIGHPLDNDGDPVDYRIVNGVLKRDAGVPIPLTPDLAEELQLYVLALPDRTEHVLADRVIDPRDDRPRDRHEALTSSATGLFCFSTRICTHHQLLCRAPLGTEPGAPLHPSTGTHLKPRRGV